MKIRFLPSVLVCLLAISSVVGAQPQEDLTDCRLGLQAQQSGKTGDAIALYESCVQKGNLSTQMLVTAYRNLGSANRIMGNAQKAVEFADKALAQNPVDPWSDYVNRGNAWSMLGQFDKALQDYDEAQRLQPNFHQAYFNRGIVLEKLKRIDEAKAQFVLAYEKGLRTPQMIERARFYNLAQEGERSLPMNVAVSSEREFRLALTSLGDNYQGRYICFTNDGLSIDGVGAAIKTYLETQMGVRDLPTPNQISLALFSRYPCPFTSTRSELRPASASEVQGTWIMRQASQALQFPPRSPSWNTFPPTVPFKCEVVAYFDGGEARSAEMRGANDCPFTRATDIDAMRAMPVVAQWSINNTNRIVITRTDVKNHVEEWEAFAVTSPFSYRGVAFQSGDLVTYLRRENGNDLNIATSFRHLRRLPN